MIASLRKPHIEFRRGVWWCTVYRRGGNRLWRLTQAGNSVPEVWANFLVWPGYP